MSRQQPWDSSKISSRWFDAHFNHAAGRVIDWASPPLDFERPGGSQARHGEPLRIIDFGCGGGITTLSLALRYPEAQVLGVDIGERFLQLEALAGAQLGLSRLPDNLVFRKIESGYPLTGNLQANLVYSWSVFEHVPLDQIAAIMADLFSLLPSSGLFFLQIEPLFYSPFGSHLRRFIEEPWAHLLWSEERLEQAVSGYSGKIPANDQGHNYLAMDRDRFKAFHLREYRALNRCTAGDIIGFVRGAGFKVLREQRNSMELEVPHGLSGKYKRQDLLNNGLLLLAGK